VIFQIQRVHGMFIAFSWKRNLANQRPSLKFKKFHELSKSATSWLVGASSKWIWSSRTFVISMNFNWRLLKKSSTPCKNWYVCLQFIIALAKKDKLFFSENTEIWALEIIAPKKNVVAFLKFVQSNLYYRIQWKLEDKLTSYY